jgi:hypothetical protein
MVRRVFIVALFSCLSIAGWILDAPRAFGHPHGQLTLRQFVIPIHGAEEIDWSRTPAVTRLRFARNGACWQPLPGESCEAYFIKGGRTYRVVEPTKPEPAENGPIVLIRIALALLWLATAAVLVLLRPSVATWAFFALSLYGWTPNNIIGEIGPVSLQVTVSSLMGAWENTLPFAAPIFALFLLQPGTLSGWRRTALQISVTIAGTVAIFSFAAIALTAGGHPELLSSEVVLLPYLQALPTWLATAFLLATYIDGAKQDRERIRWVLAGFVLGSIALSAINPANKISYFYYSLAQAAYVFFITASTAYAVLKHRIVDINVVLSRTLVYTLLSAMLVGAFALFDLFFTRVLAENNAGLIADVGLALVLGFFMNTMHHRVDRFVDRILFRKRHVAEKHIELVAQSLRHAPNENFVDRMVVDEPVRAFDIAFAALARPNGDDRMRVAYSSIEDIAGRTIANTDALAAYLNADRKALYLGKHFWSSNVLHTADGADASIAVPVFSHGDLDAIVFYGVHRNATELDGDEIALLEKLTDAAGYAYDRLEATSLRERIERISYVPATL